MTDCEKVPLIEFLRSELDGPQTEIVLAHLETCQDCRERLRVMAALAASGPARRQRHFNSRLWLLAAGVLIALMVPLLYQFRPGAPVAMEELATQDVYPAPFPLVTRDGAPDTEQESRRKMADQAYSRRDYKAAETLFAGLPATGENLFYRGVCQYYLGRDKEAALTLQQAIEADSRWRRPGLWYQASACLKLGRREQATRNLLELKEGQDEYAQKAGGLLARLQSR